MIYIRLIRASNWIKNLFVFVPWLFAKQLFDQTNSLKIIVAFFSFCFISSFVYILNDLFDVENDRNHPVKKYRPIAAGEISSTTSIFFMGILFLISIGLAIPLGSKFVIILLSYSLLNFVYSLKLKQIVIVDIFSIAAGFVLRIAAGAAAVDVVISKWLLLTTLFISLFLAIMKRRAELTHTVDKFNTRKVLSEYNLSIIDQISMIASSGVVICYALYTMADQTLAKFKTDRLIYTTIFVVFGVFRYIYIANNKQNSENVAEVILKDIPMLINLLLYIITVTFIIYFY